MKRQLAVFGISLTLAACADANPEVRPVFSMNDEGPRAIASDPYAQGKQDLAAGQYGRAVEQFMAAYRRNPYDAAVLNALGITYEQLGRRDLARRYLERALAIDPVSPVTLNNLGRSRMNAGDWQMAVAYLQRAQTLDAAETQIASNLRAAFAQAEAAPTAPTVSPAQTASRASAEMRIERESRSVQVLRTRPETGLPGSFEASERHPRLDNGSSPANVSLAVQAAEYGPTGPGGTPSGRTPAGEAGAITLVNGTGRRGMAARFRDLLARHGITATSLANADRYTYRTTTIFYQPGREEEARRLAGVLVVAATLVRRAAAPALSVRLGSDLLDFDTNVLAMGETWGLM